MIPRRETAPASLAPLGGRTTTTTTMTTTTTILKPSDYWKSLLEEWTVPILDTVGIELKDHPQNPVFLETTSDRVEAYQNIELLTAVRRRDLVTLRRIASEQKAAHSTMDACNRFGESILHLACRKGSLDVVELLLEECGCSLLVRDDYGRTILHDACWTVHPQWELLKLLLKKAPALWRVSDVRGHLALQYVPKSAWPQWSAFLIKNRDLLKRIMIHSYHKIDICRHPLPPQLVEQAAPAAAAQPPQPQQQPQPQPLLEQHPSTNDGVPRQSLPQHQQLQVQLQQQQPPKAPLPRVSAAQEQLPPTSSITRLPLGLASASQARDVLARALAQAHPSMVKAIQHNPQAPRQQGLRKYPQQPQPQLQPQPPNPVAPPKIPLVPGPATAALDEALRAQSSESNRSKNQPGVVFSTKEKGHPLSSRPSPEGAEAHPSPPQEASGDGAQIPLPYAPSISVINERLTGYQKTKQQLLRNQRGKSQNHHHHHHQTTASKTTGFSPEPLSKNPLPAVPNPLLASVEASETHRHHPQPQPQEEEQQQQRAAHSSVQHSPQKDIPSSITTRNQTSISAPVPNPMAVAASSSSDATDCSSSNSQHSHGSAAVVVGNHPNNNNNNNNNNINSSSNDSNNSSSHHGNSISSLTVSTSQNGNEERYSESSMTQATTDTDSDKVAATATATATASNNHSNSNDKNSGEDVDVDVDVESTRERPTPTDTAQDDDNDKDNDNDNDNDNKIGEEGNRKRRVVG